MSNAVAIGHDDAHAHAQHGPQSFITKYVFSTDHKVIGIQFLFTGLVFFIVGGLLVLGVRWQLAWPGSAIPFVGVASGDTYNQMFTMHASIMIFFVIIPMLGGAFGNFLIPLQIGARDMAFPWLNMVSYWTMMPAVALMVCS